MNELKKLRGSRTQAEMAKLLGLSLSYYEKLERGKRNLSGRVMKKIKMVFPDIDINIFFAN